jgi:NAD(P)-dependent dehydrogenase (short-subunit alcohol dehydrogenase family)
MEMAGKVCVVTGGATGIGEGIARALQAAGAAGVVVADIDEAGALAVATSLGPKALAVRCDVSKEADIQALVAATRERFGRVDVYVSNAGILGKAGGLELGDPLWDAMWAIHGMAHVWAARAVVPEMVARHQAGEEGGYFVVTASAAGLLTIVESAPYAVTKHAAVAFAEWLRVAYGRRGVRVSCLCPQSVMTNMVKNHNQTGGSAGVDGILTPAQVAQEVLAVMREESFLVLPHPQVADYFKAKANHYDRWLGGMQKLYVQHMG